MKVKEFCEKYKNKQYWLCPSTHTTQSITPKQYECGMSYASIGFIPNELLIKQVCKYWIEDGKYCIIWLNK